ncbi:MAG: hypothetical protein CMK92_01910 [Pseudomonas sp.]|nr:hypothetical protein [Pseudomonas sp.]
MSSTNGYSHIFAFALKCVAATDPSLQDIDVIRLVRKQMKLQIVKDIKAVSGDGHVTLVATRKVIRRIIADDTACGNKGAKAHFHGYTRNTRIDDLERLILEWRTYNTKHHEPQTKEDVALRVHLRNIRNEQRRARDSMFDVDRLYEDFVGSDDEDEETIFLVDGEETRREIADVGRKLKRRNRGGRVYDDVYVDDYETEETPFETY